MHELAFQIAMFWLVGLLAATVVLTFTTPTASSRILALDMLVLILIALLIVFGGLRATAFYLDAALVLALLSFATTLAAARYRESGTTL